jgi:hypothetical protein
VGLAVRLTSGEVVQHIWGEVPEVLQELERLAFSHLELKK